MGAEALKKLLEEIDLDKLSASIKKDIEKASEQKRSKYIKKIGYSRII